MRIRTSGFAVVGLLIAALSTPAAFAQDANDPDSLSMVDMAEQALGLSPADMPPLANLPPPDTSAFSGAMDGPPPGDAEIAQVQIAEGGGPPPGGPGGHEHQWGGHEGKWGHGGGECGGPGMFRGGLGLTDDQYEKLYAIKNDTSDAIAPKKLALHQSMRRLMDALSRPDQDSGQIHSLQSQIASLKADVTSAELGKMIAMSQVLTPDQRKTFHNMMIRHSVMSGMMHHHGGPHQGHH